MKIYSLNQNIDSLKNSSVKSGKNLNYKEILIGKLNLFYYFSLLKKIFCLVRSILSKFHRLSNQINFYKQIKNEKHYINLLVLPFDLFLIPF